jgi:V/A-type H+-transporting ATPase subunit I
MGWTILFGLLYGEAFGDLGERFGLHPLLIHRTHDVMPVLMAAIVFGVIQVMLGILLGVYNNFRVGHGKKGIFEILRFLGLLGLILGLFGVLHKLPAIFAPIGAVTFLISAIGSLVLEGIAAPLEILSAAGNMFSYARLMAIGMSSAILGTIANLLGGMMGVVLLGFIVALFFHTLNFILGLFDPTVQGLRLQFVEFFSKFFMPGGRSYRPFRKGGSHYVA